LHAAAVHLVHSLLHLHDRMVAVRADGMTSGARWTRYPIAVDGRQQLNSVQTSRSPFVSAAVFVVRSPNNDTDEWSVHQARITADDFT